jgi:peroxiredoxin Q/BCP
MSILKRLAEMVGMKQLPPLLPVGSKAPDFDVADHLGRRWKLSELRGKRVFLFFYPKASTPGCTKQACGFRDQYAAYEQQGAVVLGASFDDAAGNKKFADEQRLTFPLLCDTDKRLGLAYKACDSTSDGWPRRVTYVISPDGKIEQAIHTADPGAQAAELLTRS